MLLRAISSFEKYPDHVRPSEVPSNDGVSVLAARNGYECAQVLVFAERDMDYQVHVTDLRGEDGSVYESSNVAIYAEKYIFVDRNWHTNGLPTGNYPDALLPIKNAIEYGQTKIEAGKNKGIWLEFFIPENQKPGIYYGLVTVTGDEVQTIPVQIEILHVTIPTHTGVRSLFHTNYEHMSRYEKGDMTQMHDKYIRYLLQHRLNQTEFACTPNTEEGIQAFAEKADRLYQQGFHTFSIPSIEKDMGGYTSFDEVYLEKYIFALAKQSLCSGNNLVKKIAFYDWRIDEPFCCGYRLGQVETAVERFTKCTAELAEKCSQMPEFDTPFGREIVRSIRNACHVITDYYHRPYRPAEPNLCTNGQPYQYEQEKVTLCPPFDGYDSPEMVKDYAHCQERWWYGCNCPNAPFISYHIDDATFSPRMVGVLMARYDVVGNLYWANNIYTEFNTTGKPLFIEDPYDIAHRGTGANGEGAILYPGAQYGVDGPVGCVRLKAIREGNQDWDLIMQVKECYRAANSKFEPIMDRVLSYLCHGTKIDSINSNYEIVHQSLMRLCDLALDKTGLIVSCCEQNQGVTYSVQAKRPVSVTVDKVPVACEDGKFIFHLPYVSGRWFELEIISDDRMDIIPIYQGRGIEIVLHETLFERNAVTVSEGSVTQNLDAIRREITVDMEDSATIHIQLDGEVLSGEELGFEIKTVEPCDCEVYADGYEEQKQKIHTITRWNRIQIPTMSENFKTSGINIRFEGKRKVGVGAVYIRR